METLTAQLEAARKAVNEALRDLAFAERDALDLHDESTSELEANIRDVDMLNAKIRQNADRRRALKTNAETGNALA